MSNHYIFVVASNFKCTNVTPKLRYSKASINKSIVRNSYFSNFNNLSGILFTNNTAHAWYSIFFRVNTSNITKFY